MKKDKVIIYALGGIAAYYLIVKPILEKLNILKDAQERSVERDEQASLKKNKSIKVPTFNRGMSNASLETLANELYDSTDRFAYNYEIVMRSFAYFSRFTNSDALYFLRYFAQSKNITLYRWYVEKFVNTTNYKTVELYFPLLNKFMPNYKKMGYRYTPLDASFDTLADKCIGYVYTVAKIPKA